MLYLTGRLDGDELSIVLTNRTSAASPTRRKRASCASPSSRPRSRCRTASSSRALTRNAWCSFAYDIGGNRNKERLAFMPNGLVNQTPGKTSRWRVQNETLELSADGLSWTPQPLRLGLSSSGNAGPAVAQPEYTQCD
jgi:hypothetical protein